MQFKVKKCFVVIEGNEIQVGSGLFTKHGQWRCYAPDAEIDLTPFIGHSLVLQTEHGSIEMKKVEPDWHDGIISLGCDSTQADVYVDGLSPWDDDLAL